MMINCLSGEKRKKFQFVVCKLPWYKYSHHARLKDSNSWVRWVCKSPENFAMVARQPIQAGENSADSVCIAS
jgi:hypothetical protein